MKLCVFPNDPLRAYYEKGEIKERYFNPNNLFDEIHVISLFDSDEKEEKVAEVAGSATLKIHVIGKTNLLNLRSKKTKVISLIKKIKPDVIRSYNPLIQGWIAAKSSQKLKIPLVVSLHTNYEQQKEESKKSGKYFQYLKLIYTSKKIEKFVLTNADTVICVYESIVPYAKKMGARDIHVIYNRVNFEHFSPLIEKKIKSDRPIIISVGRLIDQKNQMYLLDAIKDMNVKLLLIGDGPNFDTINDFIQKNHIENKVEIIKSVPNKELGGYYTSCDIYAQVLENLGGIPIPILEAMSCGLPVTMSKHDSTYSEIIDDAVLFVNNSGKSFREAFEKILSDFQLKDQLKKKSLETVQRIDGKKMERKELELYSSLLKLEKK